MVNSTEVPAPTAGTTAKVQQGIDLCNSGQQTEGERRGCVQDYIMIVKLQQ